jgi:hypothetical protein
MFNGLAHSNHAAQQRWKRPRAQSATSQMSHMCAHDAAPSWPCHMCSLSPLDQTAITAHGPTPPTVLPPRVLPTPSSHPYPLVIEANAVFAFPFSLQAHAMDLQHATPLPLCAPPTAARLWLSPASPRPPLVAPRAVLLSSLQDGPIGLVSTPAVVAPLRNRCWAPHHRQPPPVVGLPWLCFCKHHTSTWTSPTTPAPPLTSGPTSRHRVLSVDCRHCGFVWWASSLFEPQNCITPPSCSETAGATAAAPRNHESSPVFPIWATYPSDWASSKWVE